MRSNAIEHEKRQQTWYDKEYSHYHEYRLENWHKSYLKLIFEQLMLSSSDTFLDIGVGGSGYTVIETAKSGLYAIGMDISKSGIQMAHKTAKTVMKKNSKNVNFLVADAMYHPLRSSSIDKIACIAVLEHIPADDEAIKEIARVLKTNGKCLLSVPNSYKKSLFITSLPYFIQDKRVGHLRHYTLEDLDLKFKSNSLKLLKGFYRVFIPKIIQILLYDVLNIRIESLWWKLEKFDEKFNKIPAGLHLCVVFQKFAPASM